MPLLQLLNLLEFAIEAYLPHNLIAGLRVLHGLLHFAQVVGQLAQLRIPPYIDIGDLVLLVQVVPTGHQLHHLLQQDVALGVDLGLAGGLLQT